MKAFDEVRLASGERSLWSDVDNRDNLLFGEQSKLRLFFAKFAGREQDIAVFERRIDGHDVASRSEPINPARHIILAMKQGLERAYKEFQAKADDPKATEEAQEFIRSLRMADPKESPDMYRVYKQGGQEQLLVLWGCVRKGSSPLLPLEAIGRIPTARRSSMLLRALAALMALCLLLMALILLCYLTGNGAWLNKEWQNMAAYFHSHPETSEEKAAREKTAADAKAAQEKAKLENAIAAAKAAQEKADLARAAAEKKAAQLEKAVVAAEAAQEKADLERAAAADKAVQLQKAVAAAKTAQEKAEREKALVEFKGAQEKAELKRAAAAAKAAQVQADLANAAADNKVAQVQAELEKAAAATKAAQEKADVEKAAAADKAAELEKAVAAAKTAQEKAEREKTLAEFNTTQEKAELERAAAAARAIQEKAELERAAASARATQEKAEREKLLADVKAAAHLFDIQPRASVYGQHLTLTSKTGGKVEMWGFDGKRKFRGDVNDLELDFQPGCRTMKFVPGDPNLKEESFPFVVYAAPEVDDRKVSVFIPDGLRSEGLSIDWGDKKQDSLGVNISKAVHEYSEDGDYRITIKAPRGIEWASKEFAVTVK